MVDIPFYDNYFRKSQISFHRILYKFTKFENIKQILFATFEHYFTSTENN